MSGTPPRTPSSGGPPARATLEFLDNDDDDDDDDVRDGAAPPPEQSTSSSASNNSAQPSAHRLAVGDIHPSALKSLADGTGDGTATMTPTATAEGSSTDGGVLGDVTNRASTADQTHGDGGFDDDEDESSSADDENIVALDAAAVGAAVAAPVRRRDAEVPGDELPGTPAGPSTALYGHGHHHAQPSMLEGASVAAPKPIVRRPREERRVCLPDALGAVHRIDMERVHDVPPNPWPISGAEGWWFDARPLLELGTFSDPAAHPDDLAGDAPFDIRPAPVGQRAGGHQHQLAVEVARGARGNTYTIYRRDIPVRGLRDVAALPPTVAPFPSVLSNSGGIKKAVMAFSGLRTVSLSSARVDPAAFASPSRAAWPISIPTRGGGGPVAPASRARGAPGSHAASSPKTQQARPSQPQPPVAAQAAATKATMGAGGSGGTRGVWVPASSVPPPPVTPPTLGSKHLVATKGVAARPTLLAKSLPSPPRPYVAVPAAAPVPEHTPPPAYRAPPPPVNASQQQQQQQSGQRGGGSGGKHGKATSSSAAAARPTVPVRGRAPPPIVVSKKLSPPPPSQPRKGGTVPLPAGISRVVNAQASSASSAAAAATPSSPTPGGVPPPAGPRFPPPPPTS